MKNKFYILNAIVIIILIFFIAKQEFKGNYYRVSPEEIHEVSLNSEIIIYPLNISEQIEKILIVNLSNVKSLRPEGISNDIEYTNISINDMLSAETKVLLKKDYKIILLQSDDLAISAKAWIILSRMGYKNIKIFGDNKVEDFNYTFLPDD